MWGWFPGLKLRTSFPAQITDILTQIILQANLILYTPNRQTILSLLEIDFCTPHLSMWFPSLSWCSSHSSHFILSLPAVFVQPMTKPILVSGRAFTHPVFAAPIALCYFQHYPLPRVSVLRFVRFHSSPQGNKILGSIMCL